MASTYLTRTPSSAGNRRTFTISVWIKFLADGNNDGIFNAWSADSNSAHITFRRRSTNGGQLGWSQWAIDNYTNRIFRDVNAWYHIVYRVDTTQASGGNRIRLYVNGEQETSFAAATDPAQNEELPVNNTVRHIIGANGYSSIGNHIYADMAHFHFCDGQSYAPSEFGETDSTTGIWKAKTSPSVSYGTNGFFLKFENSANLGLDSSGQGNNWSVGAGTMTQLIDTPTNVFATMNPLMDALSVHTFSNGNTTVQSPNSTHSYLMSTLGFSKGKYYFETKCEAKSGGSNWFVVGITAKFPTADNEEIGNFITDHGYRGDNGNHRNNNSESSYGATFGVGDIIGCAVDMDNGKLYFHKNGTYQNSGVPTSGSTGTGAINISSASSPPTGDSATGFYFPSVAFWDSTYNGTLSVNFGNGYFGTTAVSSAQNPDDGIGIFEYDVPAGYRALCTKSINAQEYS